MADRSDLSLSYISNLERGRGNPTVEALEAIAEALETSVGALVGDAENLDPTELVLASAPDSLSTFSRTSRFRDAAQRLADQQGAEPETMRQKLLVGMASAPRRSTGDPTEDDWRRLLDVYSLILADEG